MVWALPVSDSLGTHGKPSIRHTDSFAAGIRWYRLLTQVLRQHRKCEGSDHRKRHRHASQRWLEHPAGAWARRLSFGIHRCTYSCSHCLLLHFLHNVIVRAQNYAEESVVRYFLRYRARPWS